MQAIRWRAISRSAFGFDDLHPSTFQRKPFECRQDIAIVSSRHSTEEQKASLMQNISTASVQ